MSAFGSLQVARECQARPTHEGQVRCLSCRLIWDAGDTRECPLVWLASPPLFESGLAPDIFSRWR